MAKSELLLPKVIKKIIITILRSKELLLHLIDFCSIIELEAISRTFLTKFIQITMAEEHGTKRSFTCMLAVQILRQQTLEGG